MTIGQVASGAGVNVQTLRYYERRKLLAPTARRASGFRVYDPSVIRRVRFIKRAQELGFTLEEIGSLLDMRGSGHAERRAVRAAASAKISEIDRKLRRLKRMRRALDTLVERCHEAPDDARCPIIAALDDEPGEVA